MAMRRAIREAPFDVAYDAWRWRQVPVTEGPVLVYDPGALDLLVSLVASRASRVDWDALLHHGGTPLFYKVAFCITHLRPGGASWQRADGAARPTPPESWRGARRP